MGGACSTASTVNVLDNIAVKADLKTCKLDEFEKGEVLGSLSMQPATKPPLPCGLSTAPHMFYSFAGSLSFVTHSAGWL